MSRDNFTAKLLCPSCGREGVARLSEEDGYSYLRNQRTTLEHLPEGFKTAERPTGVASFDIICAECGVSAVK